MGRKKILAFFSSFFIVFQRFNNEAGLLSYFEKRLQVKPFPLKNTKLQNNKLFYTPQEICERRH